MSELGAKLKKAREEQEKTLAAVKNDTRIQETFIIAIEAGNYGALPSYLHAYGFVKKYAEYLGFDYIEIKDIFDKECPKQNSISSEARQVEDLNRELIVNNPMASKSEKEYSSSSDDKSFSSFTKKVSTSDSFSEGKRLPIIPIIIVVIVVCVLAFIIFNSSKDTKETIAPGIGSTPPIGNTIPDMSPTENINMDNMSGIGMVDNNTLAYTPSPENNQIIDNTTMRDNLTVIAKDNYTATNRDNSTVVPTTRTDNRAPIIQPAKQETVTLSFSEECWVKYTADNKTAQEFISPALTSVSLKFEKSFQLDIGNAAALTLIYDGENYTGFGRPGIVRKLLYRIDNGSLTRVNE